MNVIGQYFAGTLPWRQWKRHSCLPCLPGPFWCLVFDVCCLPTGERSVMPSWAVMAAVREAVRSRLRLEGSPPNRASDTAAR